MQSGAVILWERALQSVQQQENRLAYRELSVENAAAHVESRLAHAEIGAPWRLQLLSRIHDDVSAAVRAVRQCFWIKCARDI